MAWSRLNWRQYGIFWISFAALASRHVALLGWSMCRPHILTSTSFTSTQMGLLDTCYMLSYAFGNMIGGTLGDSYPLKYVVSLGLSLTALVLITISTFDYLQIHLFSLFLFTWGVNGLFQSVVRPCAVALMANWFPRLSRGSVMGIWSANTSVGDVIGAELGGLMLYAGFSWKVILLTCAFIVILVSFVFFIVVEDRPSLDLIAADSCCDKEFSLMVKQRSFTKHGINFFSAWRIQGVLIYSVTFACTKVLLYGMLFWLPFFLTNRLSLTGDIVGLMTALFAIGGVLGSSVGGWVTDLVKGYRSFVLMPMVGVTIPLLFLFGIGANDTNLWLCYLIIPLLGFMNAGSSHLICTAVAADLAERSEMKRADDAKATVTGIMNGVGSLGAAAGGVLIGWLQTLCWDYVFAFLVSLSLLATVLLLIIMTTECRDAKKGDEKSAPRRTNSVAMGLVSN